jgi:hypothetical protein
MREGLNRITYFGIIRVRRDCMKTNGYLIRLSFSIMLIFGGTLAINYSKTGNFLVYNLITTCVGMVLILASWMWRTRNKAKEGEMI